VSRLGAPGRGRVLWWGCTRRCPRCGGGHLFRRWFHLLPDCPRCGLHFEREEGYWAGALAINIAIAGIVFVGVFVPWAVATVPHIPVAPILLVAVPLMVVVPIIAYPWSKTIWMAIDRAFLQRLG
jgi:uncharacterized protein (DUF983 family)